MAKKIIAILISTILLSFFKAHAGADLITVQFSKNKNMASGNMIYHLVFKRGDNIVAKRSYENGKELYHYEYTASGKRGRYRTADGRDVTD